MGQWGMWGGIALGGLHTVEENLTFSATAVNLCAVNLHDQRGTLAWYIMLLKRSAGEDRNTTCAGSLYSTTYSISDQRARCQA